MHDAIKYTSIGGGKRERGGSCNSFSMCNGEVSVYARGIIAEKMARDHNLKGLSLLRAFSIFSTNLKGEVSNDHMDFQKIM